MRGVKARYLVVVLAASAVAAAVVFRGDLEHAALVAGSGALCWRVLLAQAGVGRRPRRRRGSQLATWVEAAGVAWIAARVGRPRRERPRVVAAAPTYTGTSVRWDEPFPRRPSSGSQGDDIPF